jgi:hypothetical protein
MVNPEPGHTDDHALPAERCAARLLRRRVPQATNGQEESNAPKTGTERL